MRDTIAELRWLLANEAREREEGSIAGWSDASERLRRGFREHGSALLDVAEAAREVHRKLLIQAGRRHSPYADFQAGLALGASELARELVPELDAALAALDNEVTP